MYSELRDFATHTKLAGSLANAAGTGSAQNGAAVDRDNFESGFAAVTYSTSGGVTGGTVTGKVQDSADGSTGWADFGSSVQVTIPAGPNASGAFEVPVDLNGAKRYVRVVVTSVPTGGTPASNVAGSMVLGGARKLPA